MATLLKQSENYELSITLTKIGIKADVFRKLDFDLLNKETFFQIIFCSPVNLEYSSHYGTKFSEIPSLNKKTYDKFFLDLVKDMEIESINLYGVYESSPEKKERIDLKNKLLNEEGSYLYLYTGSGGCHTSLYISIRNALAHGNVFMENGFYYLYSVSSKNSKESEYDKNINFLLRIKNLKKLDSLVSVLNKYINSSSDSYPE